jgi:hypothetical protein
MIFENGCVILAAMQSGVKPMLGPEGASFDSSVMAGV